MILLTRSKMSTRLSAGSAGPDRALSINSHSCLPEISEMPMSGVGDTFRYMVIWRSDIEARAGTKEQIDKPERVDELGLE